MISANTSQQPLRVGNPPNERPLMVYDGDCNFCRRWIERWKAATGDRLEYEPFQKVAALFPEIAIATFEKAVQLIELDGRVITGADAVFRVFDFTLKKHGFLQPLRRLPGFMPLARAAYAFVASHREFFSRISRFF